jgi:hypothetical protein
MLASCLLGEIVDVQASAGLGGMFGYTLLLPEQIDAFDSRERNEQAYVLRVLAHVRCAELGIVVPDEPNSLPASLLLLLAANAVFASLERDFPGARALREQLAPGLCARRAPPDAAHIGGVLEGFTRFVLLREDPWPTPLPANLTAWWSQAVEQLATPASRLVEHSRELYDALERELPRARGSIPEPVLLWGRLVGPAARGETGQAPPAPPEPRVQAGHVITLQRAIQMRRRTSPRREDRPLYHAFEKIETAEDYEGESGTPDAERDAASMKEALEDLTLASAVRSQERPRDLVRAEVLVEPAGLEIEEEHAAVRTWCFAIPNGTIDASACARTTAR